MESPKRGCDLVRKILAPIKKESAPPPPPKKNPKYPPKKAEFYGHGFFLQKERIFPGVHKIGAAISGPRIADKKFYGHEDFSDLGNCVVKRYSVQKHTLRLLLAF